MEHFLAREPAAGDRVEFALATFMAMYVNAHTGDGKKHGVEDFLPFRKSWPDVADGRYNETDKEVLKALMG